MGTLPLTPLPHENAPLWQLCRSALFLVLLTSFHSWADVGAEPTDKDSNAAKGDLPGSYLPPYVKRKQAETERSHPGELDFWTADRLNVPRYEQSRNLLSNPSFETGLRYYIFPPSIGSYDAGYDEKYSVDDAERRSGSLALKIKCLAPTGAFDCIQSFAYPVESGEFYTLSFYAKASRPGLRLAVKHTSANIFAKEQTVESSNSDFVLSETWIRYVVHLKMRSTGYAFNFSIVDNDPNAAVWIDDIQLEKGAEATVFTRRSPEIELKTAAPGNFLVPDQKIDGRILLKEVAPNSKLSIHATVQDFFYKQHDLGTFDVVSDESGNTEVALPLDNVMKGMKGVFVLRVELTFPDGTTNVDYTRFSIMKKMRGECLNKTLFSYHQMVVPNFEEAMKRWRDIGLGSTNYFFYNFHNPLIFEVLKKYAIEDTCALMRQHWDESLGETGIARGTGNTISIQRYGASDPNPEVLIQGMRQWNSVTPEQENAVKEAARKYAEFYSWRKNFAFDMEMLNPMLSEGNYDEFSKILAACARGVKEASAENQVYLEGGAPNIMQGISLADGLLTASRKNAPDVRYDRFAVHFYGHPENEEFDDLIERYFEVLDRHGYRDAPVYIDEGGYYSPFCIAEWGLTPYRPMLMDHYHLWSISYDMGWGERIASALTARAWLHALKYPRIKQFNMWRPFIYLDCDLTPMAQQKVVNTLSELLGDAKFKEEIIFAAKSTAYIFENNNIPIAVIWGYDGDVEVGKKNPPTMTIRPDGAIKEIVDLMGNSTEVGNCDVVKLPLTPFPIFLVGKKNKSDQLTCLVREIAVKGSASPPVQVGIQIKNTEEIAFKVKNLLTRSFSGMLSVKGSEKNEIALPSKGKRIDSVRIEPSISTTQINRYDFPWTIQSSDGRPFLGSPWIEAFAIKKIQTPISLTGNFSEWDDIPYIPLSNFKGATSDGKEEFKARFKAAWDDRFLYLLVDVVDPKLFYGAPITNSAEVTKCDVMIAYLDTLADGKDKSSLRVDSDDYYYAFLPRPEEGKALVYSQEACNQQLGLGVDAVKARVFVPEIKTTLKRTEKGYIYEVAFPQSTILPLQLRAGTVFGFGLLVHDMDSEDGPGSSLNLSHPPGSSCWRRADLWPQAILKE